MKILLANSSAYPVIGGVENSLRFIGRELLRQGHEPRIFCFQTAPDQPLESVYEDIPIVRVPCHVERWPHARLRTAVEIARQAIPGILADFQPDAVWSRSAAVGAGIRRGGYTGPMLQIFSTNARMNCRGLYLQTRGLPWKRRLLLLGLWPFEYFPATRLERELARQCEMVTFSEIMRGQLLSGLPGRNGACQVIPPGVDHDVYSPESGARFFERIEREYGIAPGDPTVLYVGRISTPKHLPMLLEAMAMLQSKAKLVLVGNGPDEKRLRAIAEKLGLGDRVIFAGTHSELLPGFYAASRVSVLPTTTESFGQVLVESLAAGTPAVGFAGDGKQVLTATAEIIQDGKTGAVVEPATAEALARGIESILSLDETAYAAMARRARADALERYSWPRFVSRALALSGKREDDAVQGEVY
jgi:glycosyltransferase involved in cell wall biosynthesis